MPEEQRYLSALCSICQDIVSHGVYDQVLTSLVRNAAVCLNAKASSVRLLDKSGETLRIAASYGLSKSYLKKGPVEVDNSPIDRQALKGKIVQIKDVAKDKRFQYPRQAKNEKNEGIKSVICVPLRCRERLLGVLRIYTDKERVFDEEEITFIRTLALQGAAAIRNAQRYQRLKDLNSIGQNIASQLKTQEIPKTICQSATEEMYAKGASMMLINRETKQLEVAATYGLSEDFLRKGPVAADKSISNCLKGKEIVIERAANDKRVQYPAAIRKEGIKSIICIPLKLRDKIIGVLRVYTGYEYNKNVEDLEFLTTLADFGVIAIENARLYEHVRKDYEDLTRDVWKWYDWGERPPRV
jgi:signal transduction protein with GAF and PtsI domain